MYRTLLMRHGLREACKLSLISRLGGDWTVEMMLKTQLLLAAASALSKPARDPESRGVPHHSGAVLGGAGLQAEETVSMVGNLVKRRPRWMGLPLCNSIEIA